MKTSTARVQKLRANRAAAKVRRIEITSEWEEHFAQSLCQAWAAANNRNTYEAWSDISRQIAGMRSLAWSLDPNMTDPTSGIWLLDLALTRADMTLSK